MSFTLPSLRTVLSSFLLLFLSLWLAGMAHAGVPNNRAEPAYAEEQTILQAEKDSRTPEPGLNSKSSGRVHIDRHYLGQYGHTEGTVIVQRGGNQWRVWRNGPIATAMGTILVVVLIAIFFFYRAVGPARAQEPDTGRRIQRFTSWERSVHWATAISFILIPECIGLGRTDFISRAGWISLRITSR